MATRDLARLGARVKAHRLQLFTSYKRAAEAGGITKDTWKSIEDGRTARDGSYAGVERALGWGIGSCVAIAEGGEPVLVDRSAPQIAPARALREDVVRSAVYEAVRNKLPSTSIGDLDGLADEVVDVLRRTGDVASGE